MIPRGLTPNSKSSRCLQLVNCTGSRKPRTFRSKSVLVTLPRGGVGGDRRSRGNGHGYGGGGVGSGGRRAVLAVALRRLEVEVGEHHRPRRRRVGLRHRLRPVSGSRVFSVSSGCSGFRALDCLPKCGARSTRALLRVRPRTAGSSHQQHTVYPF